PHSTARLHASLSFFSRLRPPPHSPLFPYTTLFRSHPTCASDARVDLPLDGVHLLQVLLQFLRAGALPRLGPAFTRALRTLGRARSEEHTSELQSLAYLVCRLLLEKKKAEDTVLCLS